MQSALSAAGEKSTAAFVARNSDSKAKVRKLSKSFLTLDSHSSLCRVKVFLTPA